MATGLQQLLQNYDSDSEEDEVSESVEIEEGSLKEQETNSRVQHPLPQVLRDMFNKTEGRDDNVTNDDSTLHDGRVRSFPHQRGNWVSFLAVSLNVDESVEQQREVFLQSCAEVPDTEFHICEDFHLSLTKTLVFRHHWIDSFMTSIKELVVKISRFDLVYDQFEVYVNDEKARTFIGMRVHPSANLESLICYADKALAEYDLEPYYDDPSYHVSIGWTLGDKAADLKKSLLPIMNKVWNATIGDDPSLQYSRVEAVQFKTGNKLYEFHLGN